MNFLHQANCWIAPALLAVAMPAFAQVFRCKQPDGRIAYQDTPCASGEQKKLAKPVGVPEPAADAPPQRSYVPYTQFDRKRSIQKAIANGTPETTMTRAELDAAMGRPDSEEFGPYDGTWYDILVYEVPDRTYIVFLQNGVVVAVQESREPVPAKPCPTEFEKKRLEQEMNAPQNRGNKEYQKDLRKRLADAKSCKIYGK